MADLGSCQRCGSALAVCGNQVACGSCLSPVPDHPLMQQMASARLAEAKRKLQEINIQLTRLNEQREHWEKVLAEETKRLGGATVAPSRPRPVLPSMIPPGLKPSDVQITPGDKQSVTEKPHAFTHGEQMPQEAWAKPDEMVPAIPKPAKQKK